MKHYEISKAVFSCAVYFSDTASNAHCRAILMTP